MNPVVQNWVYIASRPDAAHKIGFSKVPTARVKAVSHRLGCNVSIVHQRPYLNEMAREIESICHKILVAQALGGEWFRVDLPRAISVLDEAEKLRSSIEFWQQHGLAARVKDKMRIQDARLRARATRVACFDFGVRLRAARVMAGMSQKSLARAAGVNSSSISCLETGTHTASLTVRLKLAAVFDMPECDALKSG